VATKKSSLLQRLAFSRSVLQAWFWREINKTPQQGKNKQAKDHRAHEVATPQISPVQAQGHTHEARTALAAVAEMMAPSPYSFA
jgi:hypothetical protein